MIYHHGQLLPDNTPGLSLEDHAALYGLGFFETFRTSCGRPVLWKLHRERLRRACATARVALPDTFLGTNAARLGEIVGELLAARGAADAVFRYTVTAGPVSAAGTYEQPGEWLMARPLPAAAPAEGIALRVLALARDSGEWLPRPKSLNFANAIAGANELKHRGAPAEDEGLFLARDSRCVVEAVRHTLAWVQDGGWRFPDPALGAVDGTCLRWAGAQGRTFVPARASVAELGRAEAVVVMNAVRGITPVRALWSADDREMLAEWNSHAHPLVAELRRCWAEMLERAGDERPFAAPP